MILGEDNIERLPLPVGTSDWATFSRDSYCVDKTLMTGVLRRCGDVGAEYPIFKQGAMT